MKNHLYILVLLFGIAIGCVSAHVATVPDASAQPNPSGMSECVLYVLNYDGDHADLAANAKSIRGWTPVGGFGSGVVLCR